MLKSVLPLFALVTLSATSVQAAEFVNKDGSKLSDMCIAAVEANGALSSLYKAELQGLVCNGMPIREFAKKYREQKVEETVNVVSFRNANNSIEAELCIAAATSNEKFAKAVSESNEQVDIDDIACNGKKLARFAKKYNRSFNGE